MEFIWEGLKEAFRLVLTGDREVFHAASVSFLCTLSAVTLASLVAIPYGAWLGLHRPRLYRTQVFLLRWAMFVPTVVVGTIVFGVLSRRGPLGALDMLYTKRAIVIGEFLLAFPILGSMTHAAAAGLSQTVVETTRTLGAGPWRTMWMALGEVRVALHTGYLLAFARCFSELGVAIPVGGNLELRTRTLASTIVLDLSKGRFGKGLAPGIILLTMAGVIALVAIRLDRERRR